MKLLDINEITNEGLTVFMPSGFQATLYKRPEGVLIQYTDLAEEIYPVEDFNNLIDEGIEIFFDRPTTQVIESKVINKLNKKGYIRNSLTENYTKDLPEIQEADENGENTLESFFGLKEDDFNSKEELIQKIESSSDYVVTHSDNLTLYIKDKNAEDGNEIVIRLAHKLKEAFNQADCPAGSVYTKLKERNREYMTAQFKNALLSDLDRIAKEYPIVSVRQDALSLLDDIGMQEYCNTPKILEFVHKYLPLLTAKPHDLLEAVSNIVWEWQIIDNIDNAKIGIEGVNKDDRTQVVRFLCKESEDIKERFFFEVYNDYPNRTYDNCESLIGDWESLAEVVASVTEWQQNPDEYGASHVYVEDFIPPSSELVEKAQNEFENPKQEEFEVVDEAIEWVEEPKQANIYITVKGQEVNLAEGSFTRVDEDMFRLILRKSKDEAFRNEEGEPFEIWAYYYPKANMFNAQALFDGEQIEVANEPNTFITPDDVAVLREYMQINIAAKNAEHIKNYNKFEESIKINEIQIAGIDNIYKDLQEGHKAGFDPEVYGNWVCNTSLDNKWETLSKPCQRFILDQISYQVAVKDLEYDDFKLIIDGDSFDKFEMTEEDLRVWGIFEDEEIQDMINNEFNPLYAYISYQIKFDSKIGDDKKVIKEEYGAFQGLLDDAGDAIENGMLSGEGYNVQGPYTWGPITVDGKDIKEYSPYVRDLICNQLCYPVRDGHDHYYDLDFLFDAQKEDIEKLEDNKAELIEFGFDEDDLDEAIEKLKAGEDSVQLETFISYWINYEQDENEPTIYRMTVEFDAEAKNSEEDLVEDILEEVLDSYALDYAIEDLGDTKVYVVDSDDEEMLYDVEQEINDTQGEEELFNINIEEL